MYKQYAHFIEKYALDGRLSWPLDKERDLYLRWIRGDGWFMCSGSNSPTKLSTLDELKSFDVNFDELEQQLMGTCIQETLFASLVVEAGQDMFGVDLVSTFIDVYKKHNKTKFRLIKSEEEGTLE